MELKDLQDDTNAWLLAIQNSVRREFSPEEDAAMHEVAQGMKGFEQGFDENPYRQKTKNRRRVKLGKIVKQTISETNEEIEELLGIKPVKDQHFVSIVKSVFEKFTLMDAFGIGIFRSKIRSGN